MNKPVSGFTVAFALAVSFGLIWLGLSGIDVEKLAHAFFGMVLVGLAAVMLMGVVLSFFRP
jgi:hypothetical protein